MNSNFSLKSFFSGPSDMLVTILDSHCVSKISEIHSIKFNDNFLSFQTNSDNDIAPEITFEKEPPPTEWHIAACNDIERFDILTVRLIWGCFLLASLIMNCVKKKLKFLFN